MTIKKGSTPKERIVTFDLIRGYFLFVILIDHLGRFFGFWEIFTGRGAQWVSAAEGFFFVSGIMLGMVRGRKMLSEPIRRVANKVWRRAFLLYFWTVGLSLFFSWVAHNFSSLEGLKAGIYSAGGTKDLIIDTLRLKFMYGWGDFLGYYAAYLAFTPFAIYALRKKLWPILMGFSLLLWSQTTTIMGSWQILFFSGLVVGFYYQQIVEWAKALPDNIKKVSPFFIYIVTAVSLALSLFYTTFAEELGERSSRFLFLGVNLTSARQYGINVLHPYFDKEPLAIGRLILFYFWFSTLYLLVSKYEGKLREGVGKVLIPFGQNSLYVYICHAVILYFMDIIIPLGQPWPMNVLINTVFVATIWLMVKKRFLFKFIPR